MQNQIKNFIDNEIETSSMQELFDMVDGTLLGDANIRTVNGKYPTYKLTAKDKNFLLWFENIFKNFGIKSWISQDNKISDTHSLGFYINTCPYPIFKKLQTRWYKKIKNKNIKIVPKNLKITPTLLLHWYLGDGSLPRRSFPNNIVPIVVLATNNFLKEDVDFLIQQLKDIDLNFYPVMYRSGFTGKKCGYAIYSKTQDGTPLRFFQFIGFKPPKRIENCITGRKGPGANLHYFRGKWPTNDEWIKIFSNENFIGKIIKKKRKDIGLSSTKLAQMVNVSSRFMRHIEFGDRCPSVSNFKKILNVLDLDHTHFLKESKASGETFK